MCQEQPTEQPTPPPYITVLVWNPTIGWEAEVFNKRDKEKALHHAADLACNHDTIWVLEGKMLACHGTGGRVH